MDLISFILPNTTFFFFFFQHNFHGISTYPSMVGKDKKKYP